MMNCVRCKLARVGQVYDAGTSAWVDVTDGGAVTITTALGGEVTINSDGTFAYTAPDFSDHGNGTHVDGDGPDTDTFQYRAVDNTDTLLMTPATVEVDILDTVPQARPDFDAIAGAVIGDELSHGDGRGAVLGGIIGRELAR